MLRFLSKLLGARTIEAETLGILNLCGDGAAGWAAADKAALAQLFQNVKESEQQPPGCNLLLLYCTIDNDGSIVGSRLGLREIIRDSGAPVVVVASPNSGESYKAGAKERPYGQAQPRDDDRPKGRGVRTVFPEALRGDEARKIHARRLGQAGATGAPPGAGRRPRHRVFLRVGSSGVSLSRPDARLRRDACL